MNALELENILTPLFENSGFDIVDVKVFRAKALNIQIFIDKENGAITIKDCENWTDKIASYIDMNSIIAGEYIIEISSPGIDRIIKKPKDFIRFKGKDVKITLKKPFDGARVYYSKIVELRDNKARFEDGLEFDMDDVQEIRLNPDDNEIFKTNKK